MFFEMPNSCLVKRWLSALRENPYAWGLDLKLIAWDHNRDDLFLRAHTSLGQSILFDTCTGAPFSENVHISSSWVPALVNLEIILSWLSFDSCWFMLHGQDLQWSWCCQIRLGHGLALVSWTRRLLEGCLCYISGCLTSCTVYWYFLLFLHILRVHFKYKFQFPTPCL